jgi:uncharacterized protein (DUF1015 family)
MERYLTDGTFTAVAHSAMLVERTLQNGVVRRGIVAAVDLEQYDFRPGSSSLIRASEETIPSRLPARASIRRNAALETPHVLVLYDDPQDTVLAALADHRATLATRYESELMMGGGRVTGIQISEDHPAAAALADAFVALKDASANDFLFATGDGNHSLAAAKTIWEERKAQGANAEADPNRYCLVELVNVYDPGLPFHPIHRLVHGDEERMLEALLRHTDARYHGFSRAGIIDHLTREGLRGSEIAIVGPTQAGVFTLPPQSPLAVALADRAIEEIEPSAVDYVHGLEEVVETAERTAGMAIVLPELERTALFPTVASSGALPRKAFSLGEARDKRYYLECRALKGV